MRAILIIGTLVLLSCSAEQTAVDSTEPAAAAPASVPATTTVALATTTSSSSTTSTTSTTVAPATTLPSDPQQLGMLLAQQLATAVADGDWETARRISPLPAWDDQTYEDGFAGLQASTVFLGGTDTTDPTRLGMYLMQVAHESRPEGDQTSIYCVRWDLLISSSTIDKIAGELLLTESGFTPPSDAEGGAFQCDGFDQQAGPPALTSLDEFVGAIPAGGLTDGVISGVEFELFVAFVAANAPSQLHYFPDTDGVYRFAGYTCGSISDYATRAEFERFYEFVFDQTIANGLQPPGEPQEEILTALEGSIHLVCFTEANRLFDLR